MKDNEGIKPVQLISLSGYQIMAKRTINDLEKHDMERHAAFGIASEAGEISALYQKVFQGKPLDDNELRAELGDLLFFIAEMCTAKGWLLSDVARANIDKLWQRYPNGFDENYKDRKEIDYCAVETEQEKYSDPVLIMFQELFFICKELMGEN